MKSEKCHCLQSALVGNSLGLLTSLTFLFSLFSFLFSLSKRIRYRNFKKIVFPVLAQLAIGIAGKKAAGKGDSQIVFCPDERGHNGAVLAKKTMIDTF